MGHCTHRTDSTPLPTSQATNMPKGSGLTKPMTLSAELAEVVGKKEASRAECIKQLWAYLKKNNLQDPANKQYFTPDKKLAKIFGSDRIRAFGMAKHLSAHLSQVANYNIWNRRRNCAKGDKTKNNTITILQYFAKLSAILHMNLISEIMYLLF